MSEFGATTSIPLAGFDVEWAGLEDLSWIYWAWKYYDDPTGSSAEGLVQPDGSYSPIVTVLSRTYPQAVAGDPNSTVFNPFTGAFSMVYAPTLAANGVTTVFIAAAQHYPTGWCAAVKNGRITSKPGASHLTVQTVGHPPQVYISVTAGSVSFVVSRRALRRLLAVHIEGDRQEVVDVEGVHRQVRIGEVLAPLC